MVRSLRIRLHRDDRETPAVRINDGVDYVVMPQWKLFLVQLLNIADLGPIFGAMQGALWGPAVFLWITFGTIPLQVVYTIISQVCFLREMRVHPFLRYAVSILEVQ